MKKIIIAAALSAIFCFAFSQTSLEEYNYVTKGYKVQIESGLDMKKGYEFVSLNKEIRGSRKAEIKQLNRIGGSSKSIAAYLIIYQRDTAPDEYICVPDPKSEKTILDQYWQQLYHDKSDHSERLRLIAYTLSKFLVW